MSFRTVSIITALIIASVTGLILTVSRPQDYPKLSPYPAIRWDGNRVYVLVDDAWYELRAIDDVAAGDLLAFCRERHPGRVRKRFSEDLVQVMSEMGHAPGATVTLTLRTDVGEEIVKRDVPMTAEHRDALLEANRQGKPPPALRGRIEREHANEIDPRFQFLTTTFDELVSQSSRPLLTRAKAIEDLDELEFLLVEQHSYLHLTGVDYEAAFDAVRLSMPEETSVESFALQVRKLVVLLGDAHIRVQGPRPPDARHLPFLVGDAGGRPFAFAESRTRLRNEKHAYLKSMDGLPIDMWADAAGRFVPNASPAWWRRNSVRELRYVSVLRRELGLPETDHLEIVYENDAGDRTTEETIVRLGVTRRMYGEWPPQRMSRVLEGTNIAFLRLAHMNTAFANASCAMLDRFRDTDGLIIDVRGNTGGTREALRALMPYFMADDEPPYVASVAAFRKAPWFPDDHLAGRYMYRADWSGWTDPQRASVAAFAETFEPEWTPPEGQFSVWHYLVLDGTANPDAYHYERPVVVLMNEDCFSATDIFLSAFKGRPNVTLVGTPSGGGSGFVQSVRLTHSGLQLAVSSMASFQRDGRLYDRHGVTPDVVVTPQPSDFLGDTDTQFDAAVELLQGKR